MAQKSIPRPGDTAADAAADAAAGAAADAAAGAETPRPVVVLGSINIDIVARTPALPRPGETVTGGDLALHLGGKGANQAVAAARAGSGAGAVRMIGALGDQSFGLDPRALLSGYGVDVAGVASLGGPSGAALIAVDASGENSIVVSPGANGRAAEGPPPDPAALTDAILLAQLERPPTLVRDWFETAKSAGATTILNAAPALPMPPGLQGLTDILIVNETELAAYAGVDPTELAKDAAPKEGAVADAARRLMGPDGAGAVIATLGAAGALAVTAEGIVRRPAHPATVRDTTGAGDCFCGALAARLAAGAPLGAAMDFAAAAAALSVETDGAAPSMPARDAIERKLAAGAREPRGPGVSP